MAVVTRPTHRCPAPDCTQRVPDNRLACRTDWFRLPQEIRHRIWMGWREGRTDEHRQAVTDAAQWYRENPR